MVFDPLHFLSILYDWLILPFADYGFMRRALVGSLAMALGSAPIGVLLILRRMSLMGDAMAHAILPGAAIGFLIAGLSLVAMTIGGLIAGLAVMLIAGVISRVTPQKEDASLAAFYLLSLALGVLIVSMRGSNIDLLHVLFGTVLAIDDTALLLIASIATITLLSLALIYRPLIVECFDPQFLRSVGGRGLTCHLIFLTLVVLNLVGGFHAIGTLMVVGIMMLPAAAARFWSSDVWRLMMLATGISCLSCIAGLLASYHFELPSGPAIILAAGCIYLASLFVGPRGGLLVSLVPRRHFKA
ncbi:MAG: transporter permease [Rhizobium sp.]|nr:transporter permease [Rhizobium sp.]